ncbi:MAG: hypothetical protein R6U91_03220 [Bacillota bacterium]
MKAYYALLAIAVLLVLVLFSWIAATAFGPYGPQYLRYFSLLFGPLGLLLIFMQFVLVSRIKLIERGIGLDRFFPGTVFLGESASFLFFYMQF